MPVIFASCASMVAASLAAMLVAVPSMAMTRVKLKMLSEPCTPSCPAVSAISASSVVESGISCAIAWRLSAKADSCTPLMSVVLATPAMALSNSIDFSTHSAKPSAIFLSAATIPAPAMAAETSCMASCVSFPKRSMLVAHPSALLSASSRYALFFFSSLPRS